MRGRIGGLVHHSVVMTIVIITMYVIIFNIVNIEASRGVHRLGTVGSYESTITTVGTSCSGSFRLGKGVISTFSDVSSSCSLRGLDALCRRRIGSPGTLSYGTSPSKAADGTGARQTTCSGRTEAFRQTLAGGRTGRG